PLGFGRQTLSPQQSPSSRQVWLVSLQQVRSSPQTVPGQHVRLPGVPAPVAHVWPRRAHAIETRERASASPPAPRRRAATPLKARAAAPLNSPRRDVLFDTSFVKLSN